LSLLLHFHFHRRLRLSLHLVLSMSLRSLDLRSLGRLGRSLRLLRLQLGCLLLQRCLRLL